MPFRRRRNFRRRRAVTRRPRRNNTRRVSRKRRNNMIASIAKIPGLTLPDRLFVSMPFSYLSTYTWTGSGLLTTSIYSGNNINDPSGTMGALHPAGWPMYNTMYDIWRVYASSITCKFMSAQDPTLPSTVRVAVIPVDNGTTPTITNINDWISQKYAKFRVYNATTTFPTIRHRMGCAKINGENRESVRDSDAYTSTFAANPTGPTKGFNWYVVAQPLASTTMNISVQVRIIYNVELLQRKEQLQA
ncbi:MAG: capsid protein [Wigfec virus K19_526]|nr:MAG: capsid protein [Wigfec virus K19_526]